MPDAIQFICPECGTFHNQWMGFCYACGSGEPLVETAPSRSAYAPGKNKSTTPFLPTSAGPVELSGVSLDDEPRIVLPFAELNRVLGGGLVPGSVALLAGDPGIGKSTLMLQVAGALAPRVELADSLGSVLYVAGEESAAQIRMRAERLGVSGRNLMLLNETAAPDVLGWMDRMQPCAVLVDSIQTLHSELSSAAPGSVGQIRECARLLIAWAKMNHTPVIIAGHVTKEGDVAGPRVLEHMVDVVLYLEGESMSALRLLRSEKNRYGSTNEVALFQMDGAGLVEVADPSRQLLAHRNGPLVGSALTPVLQGTRPMLVEVQALTAPGHRADTAPGCQWAGRQPVGDAGDCPEPTLRRAVGIAGRGGQHHRRASSQRDCRRPRACAGNGLELPRSADRRGPGGRRRGGTRRRGATRCADGPTTARGRAPRAEAGGRAGVGGNRLSRR